MFIELLFLDSQFQCGQGAPLAEFEILVKKVNGEEISLKKGDSLVLEKKDYVDVVVNPVSNADCVSVLLHKSASINNIPDIEGLYNQPNISSYIEDLKDAEEIFLYEFGGSVGPSADWQDLILKIDWDYSNNKVLYAD